MSIITVNYKRRPRVHWLGGEKDFWMLYGELERQPHFNRWIREQGHSRGRRSGGIGSEAKTHKTFSKRFSCTVGNEGLEVVVGNNGCQPWSLVGEVLNARPRSWSGFDNGTQKRIWDPSVLDSGGWVWHHFGSKLELGQRRWTAKWGVLATVYRKGRGLNQERSSGNIKEESLWDPERVEPNGLRNWMDLLEVNKVMDDAWVSSLRNEKVTASLSSLPGKRMNLVLDMFHLGCYWTPNWRCQSEVWERGWRKERVREKT